jgi:hypothetical protein
MFFQLKPACGGAQAKACATDWRFRQKTPKTPFRTPKSALRIFIQSFSHSIIQN